jgi:Domain of unknown function (DUF4326)
MSGPRRIQLRRTRGWRKPEGVVVVSRPSRWGNPFPIEPGTSRERSIELFHAWLLEQPDMAEEARRELRGRDLACWCPLDVPCHADVLLEVANAPDDGDPTDPVAGD